MKNPFSAWLVRYEKRLADQIAEQVSCNLSAQITKPVKSKLQPKPECAAYQYFDRFDKRLDLLADHLDKINGKLK